MSLRVSGHFACTRYVRFTPKSGHWVTKRETCKGSALAARGLATVSPGTSVRLASTCLGMTNLGASRDSILDF